LKLTNKQELFCQSLVSGNNQREAYLLAYPSSKNWKKDVVDVKASELANSGKILVRIEELQKPLEDLLNKNRFEIIQRAIDIGLNDEKVNSTTVAVLSKLLDKLLPTKTETKNENKNTGLIHLVRDVKQARRNVTRTEKKK